MGVSEIGFPQNVVYRTRIQTSDTLPVTIGASKYCEFLFDIDAGDRMTPLGIVGWGCNDKTQVFLLDFYMDADLQTAKLILKNPYATTIAITSLYIDVIYSKQALDMSEVDVVDDLTTDSAVAALSARQGKILNEEIQKGFVDITSQFTVDTSILTTFKAMTDGKVVYIQGRFKRGMADETNLITIPSQFRPLTAYLAFSVFPLHGEDLAKGAAVGHVGDGVLRLRISTPNTGQYGIAFSGSWIIGF